MRANRERGEHGTENAGSCSGPNGECEGFDLHPPINPPAYSLTIQGPPRTKKTSNRVVRAGRRLKVLPSAAYCEWARSAKWQAKLAWARPPLTCEVNVRAVFYRDASRGDAVGYYQGLADLLQDAGVVENDRQIASWDGSRLEVDRKQPRVEVTIEALA